ncbi:transmembrane protein 229B-like [Hydractinia symbiolongicarpus]|uniref:transmembrane protein 229B-like n=1 Tax=Hydractinia symbiolongicarpus TaxID=13093 RepID=UPI0025512B3D|nr:transmembrane protein 229B-like [Hydractinia symbiolongicarpus]
MQIPWYYRLYFYGIHGFFDEVVFTCLHNIYFEGFDAKLRGYSSIYAFFLYGLSSLVVEYIYLNYLKEKHNLIVRGFFYILWAFYWEFNAGLMLTWFSACPWDYSHKRFNVYGLITLDYAPVWCFCGFLQEIVSDLLLSFKIEAVSPSIKKS